jgi:preprotein translocase subunit YajC
MNYTVIIIVGILAVALILFTIIRNQKDEKDFEQKIKNDYPKGTEQNGDIEVDEKEQ